MLISLLLCLAWQLHPFDPAAANTRDPAVPDLSVVTGFSFGAGITRHGEAMAYARLLADASPRVAFTARGRTWEGREMGLLLIGSAENLARTETLRTRYAALADPANTSKGALAGLVHDLPVLVWFSESVHGNEISGTDSALWLAWHLASAREDAAVDHLLQNTLIAVELMQNPDGRDRFVAHTRRHRSPLGPDADPRAAEHVEGWPSGRGNHYHFDMNRDWFAMTQPETRVKVASMLAWHPQIVVDVHEMSGDATFFAAEPSLPANPLLSSDMRAQYTLLGKAVGKAFDAAGIGYFHGETFDSFYPGYGESWPSLQGAVGILFEQGSARGLRLRRKDGTILTHEDAVRHQALASWAVLGAAADHRVDFLKAFDARRREALEEDKGFRTVFLREGDDPGRALALARLLRDQGIEVRQTPTAVRGVDAAEPDRPGKRGYDLPAGTPFVLLNQAAGRLARTLLSDDIPLDPAFLASERARWDARRAQTRIYDVTAWSLPRLFGVPVLYTNERFKDGVPFQATRKAAHAHLDAGLGYLVAGGLHTYPMAATLLRDGFTVRYTARKIVHEGRVFPPGSLILLRRENDTNLLPRLLAEAERHGVSVVGTDTSWFEEGPAFGSSDVWRLTAPRVLLAWGEPTESLSAGWMRYVMEQRFGYPVTVASLADAASMRLEDFDVVLMPSGEGWEKLFGAEDTAAIKRWVSGGGVLVTVGDSTVWAASSEAGLLETTGELRGGALLDDKTPDPHPARLEKDPDAMIEPRLEAPQPAFGALLRVAFDPEHWMSAGMPAEAAVLVRGSRILRPLRLDNGRNPGRFAAKEGLLLGGYVPEESLAQFAHKPFLMVRPLGRGRVVAFSEDPNFRGYMRCLEPLLGNAVFFGPCRAGR